MGVFLKQSFWTSVIIYLGVIIGFINSLILFPKYLSTEEIGLLRQIISAATLLLPLSAFGISATAIKFHPEFSLESKPKNQFFSFQFFLALIGFCFVILLVWIFFPHISYFFSKKSKLLIDYFDIIIIILFLLTTSTIFEAFLKARMDIILPNFTNGVLNRLLTTFSVLLLSFSIIDFYKMIYLQIPIYGLGVTVLIIYSYKKESFKLYFQIDKIKNKIVKILNFSFYSLITGFGNVIILNVDILMVSAFLGLSDTGIYTTAFYIAIIIEMPRRAISQISTPILSKLFNNNDLNTINNHYKMVSTNQLIIGILLYLLVIINLENIYNLIPNKENFISGIGVVSIICVAKLINMSSSFGSELIMMSKHYRFNVTTIIILSIITITSNYFLIPQFGIIGAAYAALISSVVFNLIKVIFIYQKLGFFPYTRNTFLILFTGGIVYYLTSYIPKIENLIIDIILKSFVTFILFILPIYFFNLSKEFNELISKYISNKNLKF